MQTISLLGCGKLGFPLALDLLNEGYNIKGSTTTTSKINKLKQSGIIPYLIKIEEFIEDMAEAYAWADIVICRSGAMTVSELIATNTLAILVPFPYAVDNHQTMNAQYLSKNGAGILIEESIFNAELIDKEILSLNSEKLQEMTKNLELLSVPNPEMIIADYLFG